jgi:GNAT superfamily N-acetyltransferase
MSLAALEHEARFNPSLMTSLARPAVPQILFLDDAQRDAFQDLLLRLDRDSRWRRFGHVVGDDTLRNHVQHALAHAAGVIGIARDGRLRGVLELYSCAPSPYCEGALVVAPSWRRRGLGTALLRAAAAFAGEAALGPIRLIFTRDNWPMRKLAAKADARFDLVLDEICAEVAPAQASAV